MKIVCCGDAHVTKDRPVNRTDNYWETVKRKLIFIAETAKEAGAHVVVLPGDLTDTPALSYEEFAELWLLFKTYYKDLKIVTVRGQHDLRYRRPINTALEALSTTMASATDDFILLEQETAWTPYGYKDIVFQGSNYGQSIPAPVKGKFNILVIHRMIIEEKLWSAQEEYEASNIFLRQNNFDLIISGDNHQGFIAVAGGTHNVLVNCGAMMRSKIDQVNHKPFIVLFDTDTKLYEQIFIPIEPPETVFKMKKVSEQKERDENLEAFVTGLSQQKDMGLLFEDNLQTYAEENAIDQDIMEEIYESFGTERGTRNGN